MPTIADLDPLNKEVQSLFRSGILYSHFRIKLDFSSLYVDLFFYPGQYWDGAYDSPRLDRRKKRNSMMKSFRLRFPRINYPKLRGVIGFKNLKHMRHNLFVKHKKITKKK